MTDWVSRRGIYDREYFSGSECSLFIGEVLVDEVVALSFACHQSRTPLYGYASELFDAVSKGNVLVQGQFSINFKEAGYLWLILNRYTQMVKGTTPFINLTDGSVDGLPVGSNAAEATQYSNIEQIINNSNLLTRDSGYKYLNALAQEAQLSLSGFSNKKRQEGETGEAENIFEQFENYVWGGNSKQTVTVGGGVVELATSRRCDASRLNPFDIYVTFGDYVGDDRIHHTVQKIEDVYILGNSKQIDVSGVPIFETYSFIAKDLK